MADHIPTTQTVVAKLRRLAKKRSLESSSPLHQCLESVAQESGYQHWKHLLQCQEKTGLESQSQTGLSDLVIDDGSTLMSLSRGMKLLGLGQDLLKRVRDSLSQIEAEGTVPVIANPLRGDVFIDVTIEGHRFQGVISSHPFILLKSKPDGGAGGHCALGVASIAYVEKEHFQQGEKHWAVCKYENQPCIDLTGLSNAGRRTLAIEFGLAILMPDFYFRNGAAYFYGSKAFNATVAWAKVHPRKIKKYPPNIYLRYWSQAATLDASLKLSKADLAVLKELESFRAKSPPLSDGAATPE